MLTSVNYLLSTLMISLLMIQASRAITPIYAVAGQPKVHLPCFVLERPGTALSPEVESMWAHHNSSVYLMVIVRDKEGTTETFRQPILGGDKIHPNASYRNQQFYGRVNVSTSRGLIITNVQLSDAGKFLCRFKDLETKDSDDSEVELIVFNGTRSNNTFRCLNDRKGKPNNDTNSSWKVRATVFIVLFCMVAMAFGVVSYRLYRAYYKRNQSVSGR